MGFSPFVALRYLRPKQSEGFISVVAGFSLAGIVLGVATLIVVMSVMSGVEKELTERIIGMRSHATLSGDRFGIEDYDDVSKVLKGIDGVKDVIPVVDGQVMVSANGRAQGTLVQGIRAEDLKKKPLLAGSIVEGSIYPFELGEGVLIGSRMAALLGIKPGREITLISPDGRATIAGVIPRIKNYPVAGIFEVGMFEYDAGMVIMPLEMAQTFFKHYQLDEDGSVLRDTVSSVEMIARDPSDAPRIAAVAADRYNAEKGYTASSWQEQSRSLFEGLAMQRKLMVIVLTLIIIVAAFSLISGLVMLVRSKRRDIAILRTMGATRRSILSIFLMTGTTIGALGTALGVGLGLLVAANIAAIQHWIEARVGAKLFADQLYFFTTLPSDIHGDDVIAVALMALFLAFLSTLYPAWKAARLDPAEALRYE